jgi:predicted methyltransferase
LSKAEKNTEKIPELEEKIVQLTEVKVVEDAKLEELEEEMKGVTEQLRSELEVKSKELAPVKQERSVFQANLDTAETELKILEDSVTRAKERLASSEEELAALDETQETKRKALADQTLELKNAKARIVDAEKEDQDLAQRETELVKKSKELMVCAICEGLMYFSIYCIHPTRSFCHDTYRHKQRMPNKPFNLLEVEPKTRLSKAFSRPLVMVESFRRLESWDV